VKLRIEGAAEPVREVMIYCETMSLIDTTGANALIRLARSWVRRRLAFR
jgi:hypothetical protein